MAWEVITGDCLEVMRGMEDGSVDAVVTDPPYGVTDHSWDVPVNSAEWMIAKSAVAFSCEPYSTALINENALPFRFDYVWVKNCASNHFNAHRAPMRRHERVLVFGEYKYNPVMRKRSAEEMSRLNARQREKYPEVYPDTILDFNSVNCRSGDRTAHPSQKPAELMEHLIRTHTDEGDTILDPFCGSGTTGVACIRTGRNFIGIEINEEYADIARRRCEEAERQGDLFVNAPKPKHDQLEIG